MLVTKTVTAGGYVIDVDVSMPVNVPSGSLVPANVVLELPGGPRAPARPSRLRQQREPYRAGPDGQLGIVGGKPQVRDLVPKCDRAREMDGVKRAEGGRKGLGGSPQNTSVERDQHEASQELLDGLAPGGDGFVAHQAREPRAIERAQRFCSNELAGVRTLDAPPASQASALAQDDA